MSRFPRFVSVFIAVALLVVCGSCAFRQGLRTRGADPGQVTGRYTLILYGCNYFEDPATVAILGKEGGAFVFEPYAPEFNYRIIKDLPAQEALKRAETFVDCNSSYKNSILAGIVGPEGRVLGYEIRPLYFTFRYGIDDVLNTFYWIRNGTVHVSIRVKPAIERQIENGGGGRHWE